MSSCEMIMGNFGTGHSACIVVSRIDGDYNKACFTPTSDEARALGTAETLLLWVFCVLLLCVFRGSICACGS